MTCAEAATLAPLYLSGELDAAQAAALLAHLQTCPACARDLDQQRDLDARVRGTLLAEDTNAAALMPAIHRRIAAAEARRRVLTMGGVAAGVMLTAGLLIHHFAIARALPVIFADAAADHRREVIEKRVKKWRTEDGDIAELAERQGISTQAISRLAAAGYRLERARLCKIDGRIFMHLVYTDGTRQTSVFLRPQPGDAVALRAESVGPEHVVAVQSGRMSVVCVGEESRAALSLAQSAATL